jgi:hypothetical protein
VEDNFLDDAIIDLVADMARIDAEKTMALLCGLLIGLAESCAETQGQNPTAKMELAGLPRTVTISAATT